MGFEESSPALWPPSIFGPRRRRPLALPLDRPDRLAALLRHLPFPVEDFDAAREAYVAFRLDPSDERRRAVHLWAYGYVVWYFSGKFARERTGSASDFDRVVERACRRVFGSLGSVREPDRFPQYVSVVCHNVLKSYRERRRVLVEADETTAPTRPPELDAIDRPVARRAIERAIAALPPAVGEVARMRLLEGLSYEAIAEATGHPLATARTYYSKAIMRLRDDPDLRAVYYGEPPPGSATAPE